MGDIEKPGSLAHGKVLFEKSYGWSDHDQARPNDTKTVFRIQSMSKTFTAMATLMLVERGRLSLDDRVVDYVPELAHGEGITLRHLLQMESGIFDFVADPEAWENIDSFRDCLVQAMAKGVIKDLDEAREVVKRSVQMKHYEPMQKLPETPEKDHQGHGCGDHGKPEREQLRRQS